MAPKSVRNVNNDDDEEKVDYLTQLAQLIKDKTVISFY